MRSLLYRRRTVGGFLVGRGGILCLGIAATRAVSVAEGDHDASTELAPVRPTGGARWA